MIMRTSIAVVICCIALTFAPAAQAITLQEFSDIVSANDDASLNKAILHVQRTESPEFLVRAERKISALYDDVSPDKILPAHQTMIISLLSYAANMTPSSFDEEKWISRAEYDLGKYYLAIEEKRDEALVLLQEATDKGHPRAPARLAEAIMDNQPEQAVLLFSLSLSRGNSKAEKALVALRQKARLRALGIHR